ncbi:hypothetical protein F5887DRAFT_916483 [Amanita rubescens]|nr:hypothetical protein F5887DRAFT_916483 [Amanita rubescens]
MLLFPELIHHICTFCVPASLAALACANSSLQKQAEIILYRKVSDGFWSDNRCIQSLCASPTRASFVQSLAFVLPHLGSSEVLELLAAALTQMPSLLDLRVKVPGGYHAAAKEVLDRILTKSCFQLRTLYCDHSLNVASIIEHHSDLQFLGLYTYGCDDALLLQEFHGMDQELRSRLPRIFTLEPEGLLPNLNHLSVFPALYAEPAEIFGGIVRSLDQDIGSHYITNSADIRYVSVFLESFSDTILIRDLFKGMSKFPNVIWLRIYAMQQSIHYTLRPGGEFTKALSIMRSLRRLELHGWSIDGDAKTSQGAPENVKFKLLEEWSAVCPRLLHVTFMDSKAFARAGPDSAWAFR